MTKKHQALLAWNLMQFSKDGQKWGKSEYAEEVRAKRKELVELISLLNKGRTPVIPSWVKEPPSLYEPGWYLRQDCIWQKNNPMPESVTDRCTKSHEYVFLLSKSARYFYDHIAIKEPAICGHIPGNNVHKGVAEYAKGDDKHRTKGGLLAFANKVRESRAKGSFQAKGEPLPGQLPFRGVVDMRNKRSVWTIATRPFNGRKLLTDHIGQDGTGYTASIACSHHAFLVGAKRKGPVFKDTEPRAADCLCQPVTIDHFAVFPPQLVTPCILSGTSAAGHCPACSKRWVRDADAPTGWKANCACDADPVPDVVLDPFMGSGTTAAVAIEHGRDFLGCELNASYKPLQDARIRAARSKAGLDLQLNPMVPA